MVDTNKNSGKTPTQDKFIALLKASPRSREELKELSGVTGSNFTRHLQGLLAKGKIKRNPETGLYEVYPGSEHGQ